MNEPERFRSAAYLSVLDHSEPDQSCLFSSSALQVMTQVAESGYPDEICGLLTGTYSTTGWTITGARQVGNINTERSADRFQLDPAGYQQVDRELRGSGSEIIGVFHSHPDCPAKPSPTDLENAWEGFLYPIISVCEGRVEAIHVWVLSRDGKKFQKVSYSTDD